MKSGRVMRDSISARNFLLNCIGYKQPNAVIEKKTYTISELESLIRDAEAVIEVTDSDSTLRSTKNRHLPWDSEASREILRHQIVKELLEKNRPTNEDSIKLGKGGARPPNGPVANKTAYLVTGLPASGKSSIIATIADTYGAYVIDSDYAKRKFPEYENGLTGASLVHEESTLVTIGSRSVHQDHTLLAGCISLGYNIVRPMIGENIDNLEEFRQFLTSFGYTVHLTLVDLDRKLATERALGRYISTKRYVPLSYIFDHCANNPALIYYKYRAEACNLNMSNWASLGAISTTKRPAKMIDSWGIGNPSQFF